MEFVWSHINFYGISTKFYNILKNDHDAISIFLEFFWKFYDILHNFWEHFMIFMVFYAICVIIHKFLQDYKN